MTNIYENTVSPILEAAKDRGATGVFLTGGRVPLIRTDGGFVGLEGYPPVRASDLELFLQEFGFSGSLKEAFRFHADRTSGGDVSVAFRRIPETSL